MFFKWGIALFGLQIPRFHDEIIVEAPAPSKEEVSDIVKKNMAKAAEKYLVRVPVVVG